MNKEKGIASYLILVVVVLVIFVAVGFLFAKKILNTFNSNPSSSNNSTVLSSQAVTSPTTIVNNSSKFGINTSNKTLASLTAQALTYAKSANIDWIRGGCIWYSDEPSLNKWDWSSCDNYINTQSNSFNILALTQIPPPTCFVRSDLVKPENKWRCDLTNYQNYLKALVSRYKDKVHYWEMGNEPDGYLAFGCNNQVLSPPGQTIDCTGVSMSSKYALVLKTAHDAIKAADPNAKWS